VVNHWKSSIKWFFKTGKKRRFEIAFEITAVLTCCLIFGKTGLKFQILVEGPAKTRRDFAIYI